MTTSRWSSLRVGRVGNHGRLRLNGCDRHHVRCSGATLAPRLVNVHTFGGHAVSAAAASAAIHAYDREGLIERSARLGATLLERLSTLTKHDIVGDVRGIGMWLAVEFTSDKSTKAPLDRWTLGAIVMHARKLGFC